MTSVKKLREDIDITKRELKNLRQEIRKQDVLMKSELDNFKTLICGTAEKTKPPDKPKKILNDEKPVYPLLPIGYISSCFKFKNGIPRQPTLCPSARGTLKIEKSVFTNPEHSLIGLEEFSHVWILFIFHENENVGVKAKVHPPRLNGTSVGVFSTRSPHRPSPVGLSLTKLDKIEGDTLYLSGIDLLDGTPVIDIKPYIPMYDNPFLINKSTFEECGSDEIQDIDLLNQDTDETDLKLDQLKITSEEGAKNSQGCKIPEFLREPPKKLEVVFTNRALIDLENLKMSNKEETSCGECSNHAEIKKSIVEVLQNDPRSIYRKEKCSDKLYYFYINHIHVTSWFDDQTAEVLRIKLSSSTPE
ncbi:tRNA (adenine(37)-N6)-methyltransferase isoform X2 [Parasteatoda tepidariorum]|uniref:tRNA (adenine(37)-N6)-methyltransferase isoform X2 n=1 Tax=Parasteatoda tepidariorum TaxID=114398 RepID=UPI00077FCF2B|nr:tRNA (adenine(37)-N6)-methyltransferase isoform X2 [Parasteatoda tepidariorum]